MSDQEARETADVGADAATWVLPHVVDVLILLEADGTVSATLQSTLVPLDQLEAWTARDLRAIATADSRRKLDVMLAAPLDEPDAPSIWRHVNLVTPAGESIPLLAKIFKHAGIGSAGQLLLAGRDLRPLQRAQERFRSSLETIERSYQRTMGANGSTGLASPVNLRTVGDAKLGGLIETMVGQIEQAFIEEALRRTNGSVEATAKLLGLPLSAVVRHLKKTGLN